MKKLIAITLCILWMGFIFYNSSNSGDISEERSHALLNNIKNHYHSIIKDEKSISQGTNVENKSSNEDKNNNNNNNSSLREEKFNKFLRKNAHAFEYFVLAIFVCALLFSFNVRGKDAVIYIMFICLFYAVTDEFHQIFVPGRSSLVSDVLIDFLGSLLGMGLFYSVSNYFDNLSKKE